MYTNYVSAVNICCFTITSFYHQLWFCSTIPEIWFLFLLLLYLYLQFNPFLSYSCLMVGIWEFWCSPSHPLAEVHTILRTFAPQLCLLIWLFCSDFLSVHISSFLSHTVPFLTLSWCCINPQSLLILCQSTFYNYDQYYSFIVVSLSIKQDISLFLPPVFTE